jgi:hypothetical protein
VSAWCARQRPVRTVRTVRTVFRGSSYPPFRVCPPSRDSCAGGGRSMRRAKPGVVPLLASGGMMWAMDVQLVDFKRGDVERIEPWFDDPDTQQYLGGRDWIRREPSLLELTIGDEFRGKVVTARRMWLSLEERGEPVAFVDRETYNRFAAWDGSVPDDRTCRTL